MKKVIFLFVLVLPSMVFAQFSDDFSDGRILSGANADRDVDWIGDNADFTVNSSLQLQLYTDGARSVSQLKTHSSLVENASWEFFVKLQFNPTVSNYAKIYIASDEENLTEDLNGLFIRVGYTDKNICLISSQKEQNNKTLIQGRIKRLDLSSVLVNIKATLDSEGKFTLYSRLEGETEFSQEGSCIVNDIPDSEWFGIVCVYTPTRSKSFYFDDFVVQELSDDSDPGTDPDPDDDSPAEGEILFSEIMANPATGNPEYVELYNTTDKSFLLKNCLFFYDDKSFKLPDKTITPHSYFVLCKTTTTNWFGPGINAFGVTSFPTLANGGQLLRFETTNGELISWFEYSDVMYRDNEKKKGGWALECIDLSNLSNTGDNWSASVQPTGGTPGQSNSITSGHADSELPILLSYLAQEDNSLKLTFSKPMNRTTLLDNNSYAINDPDYQISNLQTNYPQGTELTLQLTPFPPRGEIVTIELDDIRDLSGHRLEDETILFGNGYEAEPNDFIINELLFNPPTGGNEYVELYNHSDKILDLRYLSITSRKPSDGSFNKLYPLTTLPLFLNPGEYLVVTKSQDLICEYYTCLPESFFVELPVMPSIANTSGCVVIINNLNNEIVDELAYNEKMHSEGVSNKKGVALERVDFNVATDNLQNWQSATAQSGYGTPGYKNSQFSQHTESKNSIKVEYPSLGIDKYRIKYHLDQSGYKCMIYLYDVSGRMIDILVNNELLGIEGEILWDTKQNLTTGIYIVYVELYNMNGKTEKIKLPVVF